MTSAAISTEEEGVSSISVNQSHGVLLSVDPSIKTKIGSPDHLDESVITSSVATASDLASTSAVYIRVKRKRGEEPLETLVVQADDDQQKRKMSKVNEVAHSLAQLHTDEKPSVTASSNSLGNGKKFVFTRVNTMDVLQQENDKKASARMVRKMGKNVAVQRPLSFMKKHIPSSRKNNESFVQKVKAQRFTEIQRQRGMLHEDSQSNAKSKMYCLVDIAVATCDPTSSLGSIMIKEEEQITLNGEPMMRKSQGTKVFTPFQRKMDECIWTAFQCNDFSQVFQLLRNGMDVNFQRQIDQTTALMAAARHGRVDVIEQFLRIEARILLKDSDGRTAADFARLNGHLEAAVALEKCSQLEEDKDYVYDVYCVDMEASKKIQEVNENRNAESVKDEPSASCLDKYNALPLVSLGADLQAMLTHSTGENGEDLDFGSDEEDHESFDDDIDSNDENYEFNDYPDEEESSDSEDDSYRMDIWKPIVEREGSRDSDLSDEEFLYGQ